jgi:general secretion pathway protein L
VLLALAGLNSYARLSMLEQREKAIDDKLCETTQKVLGKCQRDFTIALSMLRGSGTPTAAIPQVSAVEILAEATSRFPTEGKAKITETEITLNRMRLKGSVDSFDAVDKLTTKLKEYRCFSAINRGKVEKSKIDPTRVDFTLDIEIGCGQPNQG